MYRDQAPSLDGSDAHLWQRNAPLDRDRDQQRPGTWARPRMEGMPAQRPSLTADLHAREKRVSDMEREDPFRRRGPADHMVQSQPHGGYEFAGEPGGSPPSEHASRYPHAPPEGRQPYRGEWSSGLQQHEQGPPDAPVGQWPGNSHTGRMWEDPGRFDYAAGREGARFPPRANMMFRGAPFAMDSPTKGSREHAGMFATSPAMGGDARRPSGDFNNYPFSAAHESSYVDTVPTSQQDEESAPVEDEDDGEDIAASSEAIDSSAYGLGRLADIEDEMAEYQAMLDALDLGLEASTLPEKGEPTLVDEKEVLSPVVQEPVMKACSPAVAAPPTPLTLPEIILKSNRLKSHQAHIAAAGAAAHLLPGAVDRYFASPNDYSFYLANIALNDRIKKNVHAKVSDRFMVNARKCKVLRKQYKSKLGEWRRTEEEEHKKKKRRLAKEKALKAAAMPVAPGYGPGGSSHSANPSGSSRGSRRTGFTSDSVKSEIEFLETLAMLKREVSGESSLDDADYSSDKEAYEPAMVIDPVARKMMKYHDMTTFVSDPAGDLERYNAKLEMSWTAADRQLFKQKLLAHGKRFHLIAEEFPRKTTNECVHFYYREKYRTIFKIPKNMARRGKGAPPVAKRKEVPEPPPQASQPLFAAPEDSGSVAKEDVSIPGSRNRRGRVKAATAAKPSLSTPDSKAEDVRRTSRIKGKNRSAGDAAAEAPDDDDIPTIQEALAASKTRNGGDNRHMAATAKRDTTRTENHADEEMTDTREPAGFEESLSATPTSIPAMIPKSGPAAVSTPRKHTGSVADPSLARQSPASSKTTAPSLEDHGLSHAMDIDSPSESLMDGPRRPGLRRREPEEAPVLDHSPVNDPTASHLDPDLDSRSSPQPKRTISYWNTEETVAFRSAYAVCGRNWDQVADRVGSKSAKQAQNYYKRNQMEMDLIRLSDAQTRGEDVTVTSDVEAEGNAGDGVGEDSEVKRFPLGPLNRHAIVVRVDREGTALRNRHSKLNLLFGGTAGPVIGDDHRTLVGSLQVPGSADRRTDGGVAMSDGVLSMQAMSAAAARSVAQQVQNTVDPLVQRFTAGRALNGRREVVLPVTTGPS
ncbi:hypothetical protein HKX48_007830 [Thoreauomyces humboldtii]|nr:hypothetical protein HKX48_007830 [Thoreauomyces humboldtii]